MIERTFRVIAGIAALTAGVSGCGSDSSSGGSCNTSGTDLVFSGVTKDASSDAACPVLTPADLTSGGDSGSNSCTTVIDHAGCSAQIECSDAASTASGSFKVTGTAFSGSMTITIKSPSTTCKYAVTGTVK